mmetsp:Transcript_23793/g.68868  ORF Transcript_23793/g.68868 Transcript_23793/m.68868 type:complete len:279 (-) Transcript_23793:19-855(-)
MVEQMSEPAATLSPSEERLLDAEEIEKVASTLKRPTARMQLESLAKKLRKEAAALKVVEGQGMATTDSTDSATTSASSTPVVTPTVIPPQPPKPLPVPAASLSSASSILYSTIDRFSFDAGGYNEKFVTLYVPLPGVGDIPKDQVTCNFDKAAFDLIVNNLNGQSYRLKKDDLEHDIVPNQSKIIIKADKVVIKLAKVKGEYGSIDYWSKLTDPKRKDKDKKKLDPSSSITELMKEMYESGDDNIRKIIGETMMKQQRGELGNGSPGMGLGSDFDDDK